MAAPRRPAIEVSNGSEFIASVYEAIEAFKTANKKPLSSDHRDPVFCVTAILFTVLREEIKALYLAQNDLPATEAAQEAALSRLIDIALKTPVIFVEGQPH